MGIGRVGSFCTRPVIPLTTLLRNCGFACSGGCENHPRKNPTSVLARGIFALGLTLALEVREAFEIGGIYVGHCPPIKPVASPTDNVVAVPGK
jgi:hypothetical protein